MTSKQFLLIFIAESVLVNELKITRLSSVVGSAAGHEDLFLFVEKVGKSMSASHSSSF